MDESDGWIANVSHIPWFLIIQSLLDPLVCWRVRTCNIQSQIWNAIEGQGGKRSFLFPFCLWLYVWNHQNLLWSPTEDGQFTAQSSVMNSSCPAFLSIEFIIALSAYLHSCLVMTGFSTFGPQWSWLLGEGHEKEENSRSKVGVSYPRISISDNFWHLRNLF